MRFLACSPHFRKTYPMDAATQRRNLIAFHFGTKVATADVTSEQAILGASGKAYADLQRTLQGMGTHPDRDILKQKTHESITAFVDDLATINSQEEFDQAHKRWCEKTVAEFEQYAHPTRTGFKFHYGQAQKWLNMTLKYLAVLDHPDVQRVYPYLHVPLDQYVYNEASREGIKRLTAWSRLGPEKYITYQESLREMVKAKGNSCPLDWEADVWVTRGSATPPTPRPLEEPTTSTASSSGDRKAE